MADGSWRRAVPHHVILCGFGAGVAGEDIGVLMELLENGGSHDLCCTTPCDVRVHISL